MCACVCARVQHVPWVHDPPMMRGATPLVPKHPARGDQRRPLCTFTKLQVLTRLSQGLTTALPPARHHHRALFLCSSASADDRSASPPSLPPLAVGKGHLRLGEGRPLGPWAQWHPPEAFASPGAARASLPLFSASLSTSLHGDKMLFLSRYQSRLAVFFSSLQPCPSLSPTHRHTSQPLRDPLSPPLV